MLFQCASVPFDQGLHTLGAMYDERLSRRNNQSSDISDH